MGSRRVFGDGNVRRSRSPGGMKHLVVLPPDLLSMVGEANVEMGLEDQVHTHFSVMA
jgi:hypothetical protein